MIKEISRKEVLKNLERCSYFDRCNAPICPLDLQMEKRTKLWNEVRCRWTREAVKTGIVKAGQYVQWIEWGRAMPDILLKFVPERNIKKLNEKSRERWLKLKERGLIKI